MSGPGASSSSVTGSDDGVKRKVSLEKDNLIANKESEISLKSFGDYKLSRSQLRRLTDLLEATEDSKLNPQKSKGYSSSKPMKEETKAKMDDNSVESNGSGFMDTIPEVKEDEDRCSSKGKAGPGNKEMAMGSMNSKKWDQQVQNSNVACNSKGRRTMTRLSAARALYDSDEDALVGVAGKGNLSKEGKGQKSGTRSGGATPSPNWRSTGMTDEGTAVDGEKGDGLQSNSPIASQQFQCMLCEGENNFIPLNQILVHRWQHYKAVMTFDEYLQGLDNYPPEFQKPQLLVANDIFSSSSENSPDTFVGSSELTTTQTTAIKSDLSPEKSHCLGNSVAEVVEVENAPSYAVEVTVTTGQQGLDESE